MWAERVHLDTVGLGSSSLTAQARVHARGGAEAIPLAATHAKAEEGEQIRGCGSGATRRRPLGEEAEAGAPWPLRRWEHCLFLPVENSLC